MTDKDQMVQRNDGWMVDYDVTPTVDHPAILTNNLLTLSNPKPWTQLLITIGWITIVYYYFANYSFTLWHAFIVVDSEKRNSAFSGMKRLQSTAL